MRATLWPLWVFLFLSFRLGIPAGDNNQVLQPEQIEQSGLLVLVVGQLCLSTLTKKQVFCFENFLDMLLVTGCSLEGFGEATVEP